MRSRILLVFVLAMCSILCGCSKFEEKQEVLNRYDLVEIQTSKPAGVLGYIQDEEFELISKNESALASAGQTNKDTVWWVTAVAFDEAELTANRKYSAIINEKVKGFYIVKIEKMRFQAEAVIDLEVSDAPYADDHARQIAILRFVKDSFNDDIREFKADNTVIDSVSMVVNETLNDVLQVLDKSPAMAENLSKLKGMDFVQMNLGKGKIRMVLEDDNTAKIMLKIGTVIKDFDEHDDVLQM